MKYDYSVDNLEDDEITLKQKTFLEELGQEIARLANKHGLPEGELEDVKVCFLKRWVQITISLADE